MIDADSLLKKIEEALESHPDHFFARRAAVKVIEEELEEPLAELELAYEMGFVG